MWRKDEPNSRVSSEVPQPTASSSPSAPKPNPSPASLPVAHKSEACISQGIKIKGELVGTEDLFVDGIVEGKITIANSSVTVGPNGKVKADITAREVVLRGLAEGKFTADERIQIWHTARVQGDLKAERISIEDGAELRGKVEAGKPIASQAVGDAANRGRKADSPKAAETVTKETGTATGAATAGAD